MSKTFSEELDEIILAIKVIIYEEPLVNINGKRWGTQEHLGIELESAKEAKQAILKLVEERIIGEDREYEKYAKCPNGCYAQYSCRCDSAELNVKSEQRQCLYEGVEE